MFCQPIANVYYVLFVHVLICMCDYPLKPIVAERVFVCRMLRWRLQ
jgi:hypothetical protein